MTVCWTALAHDSAAAGYTVGLAVYLCACILAVAGNPRSRAVAFLGGGLAGAGAATAAVLAAHYGYGGPAAMHAVIAVAAAVSPVVLFRRAPGLVSS